LLSYTGVRRTLNPPLAIYKYILSKISRLKISLKKTTINTILDLFLYKILMDVDPFNSKKRYLDNIVSFYQQWV